MKKWWLTPISGLIKKFPNYIQFCNCDLNMFILFLRKGAFRDEYMANWERFDGTSLPSELDLEDNTDEDYTHARKVI